MFPLLATVDFLMAADVTPSASELPATIGLYMANGVAPGASELLATVDFVMAHNITPCAPSESLVQLVLGQLLMWLLMMAVAASVHCLVVVIALVGRHFNRPCHCMELPATIGLYMANGVAPGASELLATVDFVMAHNITPCAPSEGPVQLVLSQLLMWLLMMAVAASVCICTPPHCLVVVIALVGRHFNRHCHCLAHSGTFGSCTLLAGIYTDNVTAFGLCEELDMLTGTRIAGGRWWVGFGARICEVDCDN